MLSTQMMMLAERNQWRTQAEEQTVFGEFNGYLFTGIEGKKFKAFITPLAGIHPDSLQTLLAYLKKNAHTLSLLNFEASDNFLCVRIREGLLPLSANKMEYLMAQISGLLALGDMPTDACAVCGEKAQKRGLYFGLFCHLHPECKDHELVDFTGTSKNANKSGENESTPNENEPIAPSSDETGTADA
jgi:hypothetical protein